MFTRLEEKLKGIDKTEELTTNVPSNDLLAGNPVTAMQPVSHLSNSYG